MARSAGKITITKITFLLFFLIAILALRYYYPVFQKYFEIKRIVDSIAKITISILFIVFFIRAFEGASYRIKSIFMLLGNITYSIYMMHFSLQIVLVLTFFEMGKVFFNTKLFFSFYILTSVILGFVAYKLVESPAQRFFRSLIKHQRRINELTH